MTHLGKWIYRIIIMLVIILLIDLNLNWTKAPAGRRHQMLITDIILMGLVTVLVLVKKIKGGSK